MITTQGHLHPDYLRFAEPPAGGARRLRPGSSSDCERGMYGSFSSAMASAGPPWLVGLPYSLFFQKMGFWLRTASVSYTHLTLPTICSV